MAAAPRADRSDVSRPRLLLAVTLGEWGGAQAYVYALASGLRDRYDITVLCGPGGVLPLRAREAGVRVVEVSGLRRHLHPWRDGQALVAISRVIRTGSFDIVHANSTKVGLLARLAARVAGVPVIIFTAHGWAFTEGRPRWLRRLLAIGESAVASITTRIICVCDYDRQLALRYNIAPAERLVVIRNGVDPVRYLAPPPPPQTTRVKWQDGGSPVIVTMVARLAPPKDPWTLLQAARRLPQVRVVIAGDGPLRAKIIEFARRLGMTERVTLTGFRSDIPELLRASDIFVLSSWWEGLPTVVIEAMMAHLPVVATRVGGLPELVEEGVSGLLVPPRSPAALAEALARLVADPEQRRAMGMAGRDRALRFFSLPRMVQETDHLYAELLGHGARIPLRSERPSVGT